MPSIRIASVGALAALALSSVTARLVDIAHGGRTAPTLDPRTFGFVAPQRFRYRDTSSPYRCSRSRARRRMERATKQHQRRMGGR